jgi:hypothetical protein
MEVSPETQGTDHADAPSWHNACTVFCHLQERTMPKTTLTISSKNYSSWSLRGWLLARFAGLDFEEMVIGPDDPGVRAEMLLLAPSMLVPCLRHQGVKVWDTLAFGLTS